MLDLKHLDAAAEEDLVTRANIRRGSHYVCTDGAPVIFGT